MSTRSRPRLFAAVLFASALLATNALAAGGMPPNMDSLDLRPGMKGHGLTVMRGQKIERFQI